MKAAQESTSNHDEKRNGGMTVKKRFRYGAAAAALMLSMSVAGCAGGSKTAQTSAAATQAEAAETSEETADAKEPGTEETSSEETTSVQGGAILSSDALPFKLSQKIDSPYFTGTAYIESMIQNDDTYHFPATNHITFEPGARSSWHS